MLIPTSKADKALAVAQMIFMAEPRVALLLEGIECCTAESCIVQKLVSMIENTSSIPIDNRNDLDIANMTITRLRKKKLKNRGILYPYL